MKIIPILASCGLTGFESPCENYKEMGLSLDQLLIESPSSTYLAQASGNSMQGVGIFDRDLLIIDRAEPLRDGNIVIATYEGNFICKIYDKNNGALLSASSKHKPIKIKTEDRIQIEGTVIRSIRMHKATSKLST
ncbi:MAG: DNA polymerase V [Colwellia sp.]|jgi:DNA polymerase V